MTPILCNALQALIAIFHVAVLDFSSNSVEVTLEDKFEFCVAKPLNSLPAFITFPLRASRAPELALKTALAMELRAKVAFCTTAVKSLVGSAKAFSISVTAALTLVIAESAFGKPTALARYSPISAESFVSFLRLSSCCLAETSAVVIAPAVTPTILVVVEVD